MKLFRWQRRGKRTAWRNCAERLRRNWKGQAARWELSRTNWRGKCGTRRWWWKKRIGWRILTFLDVIAVLLEC